ncbi:MAG: molybdate ABC transporter substrate-binding protein [Roseobacter sp.]
MTCLAGGTVADTLTIFAAASLKEAIDKISSDFSATTGTEVVTSYAGSSALARQIEYRAPADIFISASIDWMDSLENVGAIDSASRFDLLSNRLVLIAPSPIDARVTMSPELDITALLNQGRLAMALTEAVPAGIYGKTALKNLGLWDDIAPFVAQTDNVRAALALVAFGAAPLGIVYATDAQAEPRVSILAAFPENTHPKITYPVAKTTHSTSPQASAFLDYLRSTIAHDVFVRHGFDVEVE